MSVSYNKNIMDSWAGYCEPFYSEKNQSKKNIHPENVIIENKKCMESIRSFLTDFFHVFHVYLEF